MSSYVQQQITKQETQYTQIKQNIIKTDLSVGIYSPNPNPPPPMEFPTWFGTPWKDCVCQKCCYTILLCER